MPIRPFAHLSQMRLGFCTQIVEGSSLVPRLAFMKGKITTKDVLSSFSRRQLVHSARGGSRTLQRKFALCSPITVSEVDDRPETLIFVPKASMTVLNVKVSACPPWG